MNEDVLVPSGGFLPVRIDQRGYIRKDAGWGGVIHRETRGLHEELNVAPTFFEAKQRFEVKDEVCLLELTTDGGGMCIWMRPEQETTIRPRLKLFHSCYGAWKVRLLKEDS